MACAMWLSRLAFLCATLAPFVVWQTPQFAITLCVVTPLPKVLIARILEMPVWDGEYFGDSRLKLRAACLFTWIERSTLCFYVDRRSTDYFFDYADRRSTDYFFDYADRRSTDYFFDYADRRSTEYCWSLLNIDATRV